MSRFEMLLHFSLIAVCLASEPEISEAVADESGCQVHRVVSEFQGCETLIRVLLPEKLEPAERLRTLYLLPVQANSESRYGDGMTEAKKLNLANKYRLICVAPTFSHLPWYADHPTDRTIRQETYFLKVVLPFIEKNYPTRAERSGRLLCGFSKSGNGAWTLLLRNPNLFEKAAAWDAPLMQTTPNQFGMGPIFGTQENFESYRIDRLLRDRADDFRLKLDERPRVRLIHLGFENFRAHHERAEVLLNELQIPHIYIDGPKRNHVWGSGWLEEAVQRLLE